MTDLTNRLLAERAGWRGIVTATYAANGALIGQRQPNVREYIPDYLHSVDAALTLITGDMRVHLHNEDAPVWTALVWQETGQMTFEATGEGDSPAEAVCRAWWAWQRNPNGNTTEL